MAKRKKKPKQIYTLLALEVVDYQASVDAKESAKPVISRLDWKKHGQKSVS